MEPATQSSDSKVWADVLALGLENPVSGDATAVNAYSQLPTASAPGTLGQLPDIAGYRIISRLGEGGMGTVWRAVQLSTHREVALKLMTAGRFGSDRARQRFEREIELAARLEHPQIARVYDSGSCRGLWYYAMELIEGAHLDHYVGDDKLAPRQILALIRDVCLAVHYAHQRGVIHRDIKPSNILVSADCHTHVVDFGLAKALAEEPGDLTLTQEGQYAGTPAFMSPEQAAGKHDLIDTRTDVYGLGATLYLLLTGHTPHPMSGPRYEVLRRIATEEVRAPRLMNNSLDVELESLLLRAVAHDAEQRYGSADELAQDIDRYLSGDALNASPPSRTYRVRKFVRRHRVSLTVAAGFALLLVFATAVSTWQAVRATLEQHRADEQAAIATAVNDFFNSDVLGQANIFGHASPPTTVRDALDRAGKRIGGEFPNQPMVEAAVRYSVGSAYFDLRNDEQARKHLEIAVRLARETGGEDHPATLKSMARLGVVYRDGDPAKSEQLLRAALRGQEKVLGEDHPDTLLTMSRLAELFALQERGGEAEALCSKVLAHRHGLETHGLTMHVVLWNLANVYTWLNLHDKAEAIWLEGLEIERRQRSSQSPRFLDLLGMVAGAAHSRGHHARAESLFLEQFEGCRRMYGDQAPTTLHALDCLITFSRDSQAAKLVPLVEPYVPRLRKDLGEEHPTTLHWMSRLGTLYLASAQFDKAEPWLVRARGAQRKVLGEWHADTLNTSGSLIWLYLHQNRYTEAEPLLLEFHTCRRDVSEAHYRNTLGSLARVCDATNRPDEAAKWRAELAALKAATQPATQPATGPV